MKNVSATLDLAIEDLMDSVNSIVDEIGYIDADILTECSSPEPITKIVELVGPYEYMPRAKPNLVTNLPSPIKSIHIC